KEFLGNSVTSTMNVMPPPGQTNTGAPPAVTVVSACRTERVSRTGFSVTPARSARPSREPIERVLVPRSGDHQHRYAAPGDLRIEAGDDLERIGNIRAAPARS